MRNRRITNVGLVLALSLAALSLMSFKCGGNCADTDQRCTAARAGDTIAKSIGELTTVKRDLAGQGKISSAEELKLTQQLLRLNTADKVLVTRLKAMGSASNSNSQGEIAGLLNEFTTALDDLDTNGILTLGNADARNRLTVIITAIKSSLPIIQTFVNSH
jgi:hypothetical protein